MPRFEETRHADAPPATCWQLVTDPRRVPEWLTIADSVHALEVAGVGQRLLARGGALGVQVELDIEVTRWDPPHRYAWHLRDPVPIDVTYAFEPHAPGGCRFTTVVEADLGRRVSMRSRLAVRVLRAEVARSLDRLTGLAATSAPADPGGSPRTSD